MKLIKKIKILLFFFLCSISGVIAQDVNVALGGNIQAAIDQVALAGGGTVHLAAGTYTLSSTLYLKDKVVLKGIDSLLTTIAVIDSFNVIENAKQSLTGVSIENMTIVGKHAYSCYGILIQDGTGYSHHGVTLLNVQLKHAGMGVHIKGTSNLTIENCNFHHNGTLDPQGFFHNLYLRRCTTAVIRNTLLNNSVSGNGLNISYCKDIQVFNCTANDNVFRGMRAADSDGFTVQNCTMNNNKDIGLLANTEVNPTKNIHWHKCTVNNNKNGGIRAISGVTGIVTECNSYNNTNYNYDIVPEVTQQRNNIQANGTLNTSFNVLSSGEYYIKKKGTNLYLTNGNVSSTGSMPSFKRA
jgi:parallel beta-helix repeat protein